MILYNNPDDLIWILETHLKHHVLPEFRSFTMTRPIGDEGRPREINLYEQKDPKIGDKPIVQIVLGD